MKTKSMKSMAKILNLMDMGVSFSLSEIIDKTDLSPRTIQTTINNLIIYVVSKDIYREEKRYKARPGFIKESGLNAEKMLLVAAILAKEDRFGLDMAGELKDMMNTLKRDAMLSLDRKETMEYTTPEMHANFNTIKDAIEYDLCISYEFDGYLRYVQPLAIINREYYWYLVGYEENKTHVETSDEGSHSQQMKTYSISKIKRLWITDDPITYDFTLARKLLPLTSNGYVSWDRTPTEVQVLVEQSIDKYIENARFYHNWKKVAQSETVKGYNLYKVMSVQKNYLDIIPTIMKHMPDMIVLHPIELSDQILDITKQHQAATGFIYDLAKEGVD